MSPTFPPSVHLGSLSIDFSRPHTSPTWLLSGLALFELPQLVLKFGIGLDKFTCMLPSSALTVELVDEFLEIGVMRCEICLEYLPLTAYAVDDDYDTVLFLKASEDTEGMIDAGLMSTYENQLNAPGQITVAGKEEDISDLVEAYADCIQSLTYTATDYGYGPDLLRKVLPAWQSLHSLTICNAAAGTAWEAMPALRQSHIPVLIFRSHGPREVAAVFELAEFRVSHISVGRLEIQWCLQSEDEEESSGCARQVEKEIADFCSGDAKWNALSEQLGKNGTVLRAVMTGRGWDKEITSIVEEGSED